MLGSRCVVYESKKEADRNSAISLFTQFLFTQVIVSIVTSRPWRFCFLKI